MASRDVWRRWRIAALLLVLVFVAANTWVTKQRMTDWDEPLWVAVYPINGDGSSTSAGYIQGLSVHTFEPIEAYMEREARRYSVGLNHPVTMKLAPEVDEPPPTPPSDGNVFKIMLWSLQMRWWALTADTYEGPAPDVRMFVVYFDPATHDRVAHSLGLEKGLIGVVNAFSSRKMAAQNNVVIAHELLHTLGATDKYDLANNQPRFPEGYADPTRNPLYPQTRAELMAGRIAISPTEARMPRTLSYAVIGELTAREIRWID